MITTRQGYGAPTQIQPTAEARVPSADRDEAALATAHRTVEAERRALEALATTLQGPLAVPFSRAVDCVRQHPGRLIITGVGKSGHVGVKIAATLASTGTPAFFVHAGEASHGDLGMITEADTILALSWSGETPELASIVSYSRRFRVPLIALTSAAESALGRAADIVLEMPRVVEACPLGLAPTSSALIQLALGDALAVALLEARGFSAEDFRVFHPGGRLGANLRTVGEIMHTGDRVPLTAASARLHDAILIMSAKSFGVVGVTNTRGRLVGVITDGDLRRHLAPDILDRPVEAIMTQEPKIVPPDMLVATCLEVLNSLGITAVFVENDGRPAGIVHMHDLLRIGAA